MAFLAVFAIALSLASGSLAEKWQNELAGTATIQITASGDAMEAQTQSVLTVLAQNSGHHKRSAAGAAGTAGIACTLVRIGGFGVSAALTNNHRSHRDGKMAPTEQDWSKDWRPKRRGDL